MDIGEKEIIKRLKEERMNESPHRRRERKMMKEAREEVKEIDEKINNLRIEESRTRKIILSLEKLVRVEKQVGFKGSTDISYVSRCFKKYKELEHERYDIQRQETILYIEKLGKIEEGINNRYYNDRELNRRLEKEKNIVIVKIKNLERETGSEEKLDKFKHRIEEIKKEFEKLNYDKLHPEFLYYLKRYELGETAISPAIVEAVDKLCEEDP